VETDASDVGIGVVLLQEGHPLAFVSKALGPKTRGLSTYEKEYLAILLVVDRCGEFCIVTDQRSLAHLNDQHLHTTWQHKALSKMLGLQYMIVYRKGTDNTTVDPLSLYAHTSKPLLQQFLCCALHGWRKSSPTTNWTL
jgi:hypothetical protein